MDTGNTFSNLGTGSQNVISSGTQNVNAGSGSQYIKTIRFDDLYSSLIGSLLLTCMPDFFGVAAAAKKLPGPAYYC
ncbi:hypothetical protein CPLU01_16060, partial [Colletotrichum plurivorum]